MNDKTTILLVIGKFDPPTISHYKVIEEAKRFSDFISNLTKIRIVIIKEPNSLLTNDEKWEIIRKCNMVNDVEITDNIHYYVNSMSNTYKSVVIFCGDDEKNYYNDIAKQIENKNVNIISISRNDGVSSTKLKTFVINENFKSFRDMFFIKELCKSKKWFAILVERMITKKYV